MICCCSTEGDTYAAPASRHPAAPRTTSQHNAGSGKPRGPNAPRSSGPPKVLPIDVPAISMGELNSITASFGQNALIGEGSYGKIYRAVLTSGEPVAIKKLDPSVSSDSVSDFSAQLSTVSRLKNDYGLEAQERLLPAADGLLPGRQPQDPRLPVRLTRLAARHAARQEGRQGRGAGPGAELGAAGEDRLRRGEGPRVPAREGAGAAVHRAPGRALQQRPPLRRPRLQARRLQPHQPAARRRRAPPLHARPWHLRLPCSRATPRLSEDKVSQCVDPKLRGDYPPKSVAKMAAVAALCVQYESDFRSNMTIVVKALQPLLKAAAATATATGTAGGA